MSKFKVIEYKSGLEEIVNPIAVYARKLRESGIVIDTETTGSSREDEVIELAAVQASDGSVVIDQLFRPSKRIESFAYGVHGISDAQVSRAPRIRDLWDALFPLLDCSTALAWNSSYDSRLLNQTISRYSLREPRVEWVCVMALYKQFRRLPKNPKLEDACAAMGVRRDTAHRAKADALAAARVLYRIAEAHPEDEVITYDRESDSDEADETAVTARDFLIENLWQEEKSLAADGGEAVSKWIDPKGGQIVDLLMALDWQRARMKANAPVGRLLTDEERRIFNA